VPQTSRKSTALFTIARCLQFLSVAICIHILANSDSLESVVERLLFMHYNIGAWTKRNYLSAHTVYCVLLLTSLASSDDFDVSIQDRGSLGLKLDSHLKVTGFQRGPAGKILPAEDSGWVRIGDKLIGVNERSIERLDLGTAARSISQADHPKILRFRAPEG